MTGEISPVLGLPMVDARCTWQHRGSFIECHELSVYRMVGNCANCKSRVVGMFTIGHEAHGGWNSPQCPVCECKGELYWKGLEDQDPSIDPTWVRS